MTGAIIKAREHFFNAKYVGNSQGQRVGQMVPFTDQVTFSKSVKIDAASDEGLYRDFSSPTNNKKWTFSGWFKLCNLGTNRTLISSGLHDGDYSDVRFNTNNIIYFQNRVSSTNLVLSSTDRSFEDTSIWYHIVLIYDSDQGSASDRWKVYVNGDLQSVNNYPGSGDASTFNKASTRHRLSVSGTAAGSEFTPAFEGDFAGIAQQMFFDGQAYTPDNFGQTDTSTGLWIPKTLGSLTYGNNGFRLEFANTAGQTIGDDTSGNTNDFSLYNLTTADLRIDTPSNNIAVMRNYNPSKVQTITEGGLKTATTGTNKGFPVMSTLAPSSGKWYAEVRNSAGTGGNTYGLGVYILEDMPFYDLGNNFYPGGRRNNGDGCGAGLWLVSGGTNYLNTSRDGAYITASNPTYSLGAGDVIGIAADRDNDLISFYGNNGSLIGSAAIPPGRICFTAMTNTSLTFDWNFGQNGTFNGNETAGGETDENGDGDFYHSVPSGFKMLKQDNLSATDQNINGGPTPPVPDLCWIKNRTDGTADSHQLYDSTRGVTKDLSIDATDAESTTNDGLQKFIAGGFQIEDDVSINTTDENYISWNWVAGGGTETANADGSGASLASTIQKNETAGFSIVRFTPGSSSGKVAHGLSQAPEFIMMKDTSRSVLWLVYHKPHTFH